MDTDKPVVPLIPSIILRRYCEQQWRVLHRLPPKTKEGYKWVCARCREDGVLWADLRFYPILPRLRNLMHPGCYADMDPEERAVHDRDDEALAIRLRERRRARALRLGRQPPWW